MSPGWLIDVRLSEVSPNTIEGSFTDDLVISKIWLIRELASLSDSYGTIYVLGSWFGNLAMLMVARDLRFKRIINVDTDGKALSDGARIISRLGLDDRISSIKADANTLSYDGLGANGLVINTSCNNIKGDDWFLNIPTGTMVALQGRDNDPGSPNLFNDMDAFIETYPLRETLFSGKLRLRDPETSYIRFMLIGMV